MVAMLLGSGVARAQSSPKPWDNLRGVKVCISRIDAFLWTIDQFLNEPPKGFEEKSVIVGKDLPDLVSLRLQRSGVPFEVKMSCDSEPTLKWSVAATNPIGTGYRGGMVAVTVSTRVYDAQGKAYPWPATIYATRAFFVLGPGYSEDATELLRIFQSYVLKRIDDFIADWKMANPSGIEQPNKTLSSVQQ